MGLAKGTATVHDTLCDSMTAHWCFHYHEELPESPNPEPQDLTHNARPYLIESHEHLENEYQVAPTLGREAF